MVEGVSKVVIEVEDQDRALQFWTDAMGFELVRTRPAVRSAGSRSEPPTKD